MARNGQSVIVLSQADPIADFKGRSANGQRLLSFLGVSNDSKQRPTFPSLFLFETPCIADAKKDYFTPERSA